MGESSELEEGEMDCSTGEGVVDLDVDLSYIVSLLFATFSSQNVLCVELCFNLRISNYNVGIC